MKEEAVTIQGQDGDNIHVGYATGEVLLSIWKNGGHARAWLTVDQAQQVFDALKEVLEYEKRFSE